MRAVFVDCPKFLAERYTPALRALVPDLIMHVDDPPNGDVVAALDGAAAAINDHTDMPDAVLAACPALKVIVFMGTGASSYIDVAAAERRGIQVRTIRGYGDRSVAELAVALMFAATRKITEMDRAIRAGQWHVLDSVELAGRTLGVIGTGGIGREMVKLGHALGMKVQAWNRSGVPPDLPCEASALDDLLARADVVSLHLALNEATSGFIDAQRLGRMRPEAILVNTARGALIDEAALIDALASRRLGHAALDVFATEPLPAGHPLVRLSNVTLTAHAGFLTHEASARLLRLALEELRDALAALRA